MKLPKYTLPKVTSPRDEFKFQILMLRYGVLLFTHRHEVVCLCVGIGHSSPALRETYFVIYGKSQGHYELFLHFPE